MSVDAHSRQLIANAIERYLNGPISNFELDDRLSQVVTEDIACHEIAKEIWYCFDDCRRQHNVGRFKLNESGEALVRRCVTLLRSDSEWIWKQRGTYDVSKPISLVSFTGPSARHSYWPFESENEWEKWVSNQDH